MDNDKKEFFHAVFDGVICVLFVAALCTAIGFAGKYRAAVREYNLRLEQAEAESAACKREIAEYGRRLEECARILTTASETNGSIRELLDQSVDIIDRITGTLFPVADGEQGADRNICRDDSGCLYDYHYLYNISSAKEE